MALKAGLFGGDGEDYHDQNVQPLLDQYDQQINDILASGAHGEIVRMQAQDDALGANAGSGADDGQLQQVSYPLGGQAAAPVTSYGADPSFGRAHLDVGQGAPAQGSPDSAALFGASVYPQKVDLQKAGPPDTSRFSAMGAGSTVATDPTLEDAARSAPFSMKDADMAAAWRQAVAPIYIEQGIRHALPSLLASPLPQPWKTIVTLPAKFVNNFLDESEPQRREEAYQAELFRRMNDTVAQSATSQSAPPAVRGFFTK